MRAVSQSPLALLGRLYCCSCNRETLSFDLRKRWCRWGLHRVGLEGAQGPHLRQLLQGALLVDLVGAVGDVRVEVVLGMVLQDVTDVLHTHLGLVPLFQSFEEPAALGWGAVRDTKAQFGWVLAHTHTHLHRHMYADKNVCMDRP